MKKGSLLLLQVLLVLIGLAVLFMLIRLPLTEGRAANLDLLSIYADPFILYGYAASIVFFIGLYKVIRLIGYISSDEQFTSKSVNTLSSIKYCAIIFGLLIIAAGLYIMMVHHKNDDPAGFFAVCIATTFITAIVAIYAALYEKKLRNGFLGE